MLSLFRKAPEKIQAEALYLAISDQARLPVFFQQGGVADTPEGRFEMLALHLFLALHRLADDAPASKPLADALQKAFFVNLEDSLREMGVGDLSVGKKLRKLAEAFYGRFSAYKNSVAPPDDSALASAIARNVFGVETAESSAAFAQYILSSTLALSNVDQLRPADITALAPLAVREFEAAIND